MRMEKDIIYSIIFWLGLGMIAFWIVMKLLGIFESPVWQEMLPYAGAIFVFGIFYQTMFDVKKRISRMETRQHRMANGLIKLESNFGYLEKDFSNLRQDFGRLRQDFNRHLAKH